MMYSRLISKSSFPLHEEIPSSFGVEILELCDSELFQETLQNSEVASCSIYCRDLQEHSSHATTHDDDHLSNMAPNMTNTTADNEGNPITRNSSLSLLLEDQLDNDYISASIDFSTPSPSFSAPQHQYFTNNQEPLFDINSLSPIPLGDTAEGPIYMAHQSRPPPAPGFKEECLPSMASNIHNLRASDALNINNCAVIDPIMMGVYMPSSGSSCMSSAPFSADNNNSGIFSAGSGLVLGPADFCLHQELEFQGDNGLFLPESTAARVFNCPGTDLQAVSNESQHVLHASPSTTLTSEISSLDDPTFKGGKLSAEERKRKISRYLKKRNERNFSKKIKYACRKTLADSRPRVRGRFAKNDEVGDAAARTSSAGANHDRDRDQDQDHDTDEDVNLFSNPIPRDHQHKGVKVEDLEDSDIFAHISGVNSFKCNYPIQSWV